MEVRSTNDDSPGTMSGHNQPIPLEAVAKSRADGVVSTLAETRPDLMLKEFHRQNVTS